MKERERERKEDVDFTRKVAENKKTKEKLDLLIWSTRGFGLSQRSI